MTDGERPTAAAIQSSQTYSFDATVAGNGVITRVCSRPCRASRRPHAFDLAGRNRSPSAVAERTLPDRPGKRLSDGGKIVYAESVDSARQCRDQAFCRCRSHRSALELAYLDYRQDQRRTARWLRHISCFPITRRSGIGSAVMMDLAIWGRFTRKTAPMPARSAPRSTSKSRTRSRERSCSTRSVPIIMSRHGSPCRGTGSPGQYAGCGHYVVRYGASDTFYRHRPDTLRLVLRRRQGQRPDYCNNELGRSDGVYRRPDYSKMLFDLVCWDGRRAAL